MVMVFGTVFAFVVVAMLVSFARFWRDSGERAGDFAAPAPLRSATFDAASLAYLDGGGDGCTYPDAKPSIADRSSLTPVAMSSLRPCSRSPLASATSKPASRPVTATTRSDRHSTP